MSGSISTGDYAAGNTLLPYIEVIKGFASDYVKSRHVEVYLPPGYHEGESFDVIYMHDGQNVFNAKTSFAGVAWEVDKAINSLLRQQKIRPAIVVAIWNTSLRMREYMPNEPRQKIASKAREHDWSGRILSDNYLRFMVEELKPFIDKTFKTNPLPGSTFVMGSSMGGLISAYALVKYPDVFGGAACISTHWPALEGVFLNYFRDHIPDPATHRFYFDYGTATLDAVYEPWQIQVDRMMKAQGYNQGNNWVTRKFEGASHSEKAWSERVAIPLEFLLGFSGK